MHVVDHIFILLIYVALPIYSAIDTRAYLDAIASGRSPERIRFYMTTCIMQWVFFAVLVPTWWFLDRPFQDLGFKGLSGVRLWVGSGALIALVVTLVVSWQAVQRASEGKRKEYRDGLGQMEHFLPHDRRELRYFFGVSFTAGIVEEVVFRGFALWYLGTLMPLWLAVVVSSIGFGLPHLYLGASNAVRAALVGLMFAIFYILTGSIWLPILAHVAMDSLQGLTAIELLRSSDGKSESARSC